jgi:hypothetical protein
MIILLTLSSEHTVIDIGREGRHRGQTDVNVRMGLLLTAQLL